MATAINMDGNTNSVGAAGGPYDPTTMNASFSRHGSLEQESRGNTGSMGDYLNSMSFTGGTPRQFTPRQSPRHSRVRSPINGDADDDYEDRRSERRESRRDRGEPVGIGFRLSAC